LAASSQLKTLKNKIEVCLRKKELSFNVAASVSVKLFPACWSAPWILDLAILTIAESSFLK
jgi:hypothetical protein